MARNEGLTHHIKRCKEVHPVGGQCYREVHETGKHAYMDKNFKTVEWE